MEQTESTLISSVMRKWLIVGACALGIGIISGAPALYFHYVDRGYEGIEMFGSDGEETYLAEIREVYEGNTDLGNAYLVDHKSDPYVRQPLSPLIVAGLAHVLGVGVPEINLLTKVVFPAILSILIFIFFRDAFKRISYAALATLFIMLAPATLTFLNPFAWPDFFLQGEFLYSNFKFLAFARPINPQVSFLFFFCYLIFLWRFLFTVEEQQARIKYAIAASVILGLSFYTYFFTVSYALVWTGLLFLWALYQKRFRSAGVLTAVVFGAFLIGIPYFINTFHMMQSPLYPELAGRLGVAYDRVFILSRILLVTCILVGFFIKKMPRQVALFFCSFLLAGFIVTNQQLITGQTVPQPDHYYWFFIQPFSGVVLLYVLFILIERWSPRIGQIGVVSVASFFIFAGVYFQVDSYRAQRPVSIAKQEYKPVIDWLGRTLPSDATVFANDILSNLIPVYTNLNIYLPMGKGDYLVSRAQLQHTYYIRLFLEGVPSDGFRAYLSEHREEAGGGVFSQTYRVTAGCYGCFPEEVFEDIAKGYEAFVRTDFLTELRRYPVDYIVWNKVRDPQWRLDRYFTEPVHTQGTSVVYRVK